MPAIVQPNLTDGAHTRALAAQVAEFKQQMMNDDTIKDVLADIGGYQNLEDFVPTESQHSDGSMDTRNINLWDSVFRDDA